MAGRLEDVILRGLATARPAATAVAAGTLYFSTDTQVLERSTGGTSGVWQPYSAAAATSGINQLTSDVTAGPGSGSQIATIAAHAVSNSKLRQSAAVSVVGNASGATADVADIAAAADDRLLARTGGALAFVQITVGMLPNDVVPYAKVQNVSATSRILGRKTAGAGDIEECTLGELLAFSTAEAPQFAKVGIGGAADANALLKIAGQYFSPLVEKGTSGAALTLNWNDGNEQATTLTANCTLTLTNPMDGGRYVIWLVQDGTGSRVPTFPAAVKFAGNTTPTWSTAAGKADIVTLTYRAATSIYAADASLGHG
jgi:hypothetical protein